MRLRTPPSELDLMPFVGRPVCPRCGEHLFAAFATALAGNGQILHSWSCENCDHEFRTRVNFTTADS